MVGSLSFLNTSVTPVALGTWALGGGNDWGETSEQAAQQTLLAALDRGVNLIDTAPIYGAGLAEERIGRALKGRRSQVLLATKCGISLRGGRPDHDLRPQNIFQECEASLRRLQTDYIDLYQIHWPDPKVALVDSLGALLRLQEQGKIRAIGVCNFSQEQIKQAAEIAPIVSVQGPLSLLCDNKKLAEFCAARGLAFWAYGALGGGILSGKYTQMPNLRRCDARRYFYPYYFGENFTKATQTVARVWQIAQKYQASSAAVALAGVLQARGVSGVLAGARSAAQVEENLSALQIKLTPQEQEFLWSASVK